MTVRACGDRPRENPDSDRAMSPGMLRKSLNALLRILLRASAAAFSASASFLRFLTCSKYAFRPAAISSWLALILMLTCSAVLTRYSFITSSMPLMSAPRWASTCRAKVAASFSVLSLTSCSRMFSFFLASMVLSMAVCAASSAFLNASMRSLLTLRPSAAAFFSSRVSWPRAIPRFLTSSSRSVSSSMMSFSSR